MRWLRSHPKLTILIIVILILLVLLYVSMISVGKDNFLGRTLGEGIVQIQKPFAKFGNYVGDKVKILTDSDDLTKENEELKDEVVALKSELAKEKLNSSELKELKKLSKALQTDGLSKDYDPVVGEVVSFDGSSITNSFTIDVGINSGIEVNDPVVNEDGLVGRVISTGKNWCKVLTILDESNKIGFQVYKSMKYKGVCYGEGDGTISGYLFDDKTRIKEGDEVITSGLGGLYPAGLTIGEVTSVEWTSKSMLKTIFIEPGVYFKGLSRVAVLTD